MTLFDPTPMIAAHRGLDVAIRTPGVRPFVSGWQTNHPYASLYLPNLIADFETARIQEYRFLSDIPLLDSRIAEFHASKEAGVSVSDRIFVTPGASNAVFSLACWIASAGFSEVYFIAPVYQTFFYFLAMVGVKVQRLDFNVIDDDVSILSLPDKRCCLIISDPTWIAGCPVTPQLADKLRNWQSLTSSYIIADGTFSFTRWRTGQGRDAASTFDPDYTFRLVCPTKAVALHGVRFAYIVYPRNQREAIRFPSSNAAGASSTFDRICALHIMEALISDESNSVLCDYIAARYALLKTAGIIEQIAAEPHCTYFVYARLTPDALSRFTVMNNSFFGLPRSDGFCRLNILSPALDDL